MINIYIGNLPYDTTSEDLGDLFGRFGKVEKTAIVFDRETGRSRGFGFVEMEEREAGLQAIEELTGESFRNRPLTINEARPRGSGQGKGSYVSATTIAPTEPEERQGGYRRYNQDSPEPSTATPEDAPSSSGGGYRNALLED